MMDRRRLERIGALVVSAIGLLLAWAPLFGKGSLLLTFVGLVLVVLPGFVIFRASPERIDKARRAGAPPEVIDRQLAAIQKMRSRLWIALAVAVLGFAALQAVGVRF